MQSLSEKVFSERRGRPALSLSVRSSRGEEHENACREILISSLRGCGIRVVDAAVDSSAYSVTVSLLQSSSRAPWEIQWEMTRSSGGAVVQEYIQVPGYNLLSAAELDKLGVRMAQDALRLWGE